jgi:hypothetical protein
MMPSFWLFLIGHLTFSVLGRVLWRPSSFRWGSRHFSNKIGTASRLSALPSSSTCSFSQSATSSSPGWDFHWWRLWCCRKYCNRCLGPASLASTSCLSFHQITFCFNNNSYCLYLRYFPLDLALLFPMTPRQKQISYWISYRRDFTFQKLVCT